MAVKYASTRQKMFKRGEIMPGMKGYGNVKTSRLNKGGDMKWRGKRKMPGNMTSSKGVYGY